MQLQGLTEEMVLLVHHRLLDRWFRQEAGLEIGLQGPPGIESVHSIFWNVGWDLDFITVIVSSF